MGGDPKGIYCTQTQVSIGVDTGSVTVSNVNIVSTTEITATVTPDASDPTETACVTAPGMTVYMVVKAPTSAMSAASAAGSVCTDPNIEPIYGNKGIRVQIIGCSAPTITDVKPSTWFAGKTYDSVVIKGTGFITKEKATDACPVTPVSITAADGSTVPVSNVNVESKTKITVGVAPLASDPTESATVTAGITPAVNSTQTYTAQILGNQIQCDPSMNCTQPVISTTDGSGPPVQQADVGQPIILSSLQMPEGIKATSAAWTVGGTKIAGYNPTTGPTKVTRLTEDDLKNKDITFYWVYPNSAIPVAIPVTYRYCVDIPGVGNQCSTATASFDLTGPGDAQMTTEPYDRLNVDMIVDKPPCLDTPDDSDPYLYYANASGSDAPCPIAVIGNPSGIKFTQPASSNGTYSFVQLITSGNKTTYISGNSKGAYITTPGLDGKYPYPPLNPGDEYVSDSPDVPLVDTTIYSQISRTFSANMFLMWKSSKTGAIPVPIGSQKWYFKASTKNSGYPSSQEWTQPVTDYAGKDGDPVDYIKTAPRQQPYGYPIWKSLAGRVWSTTNANEIDQEDEQ